SGPQADRRRAVRGRDGGRFGGCDFIGRGLGRSRLLGSLDGFRRGRGGGGGRGKDRGGRPGGGGRESRGPDRRGGGGAVVWGGRPGRPAPAERRPLRGPRRGGGPAPSPSSGRSARTAPRGRPG